MSTRLEMIKEVTRRLLIALVSLIVAAVAILVVFGLLGRPVSMWCVVTIFGIGGGFISVQRRLKYLTDEDLVLLASSWQFVILPPLVGGTLALILYVLFISELLSGQLFPVFEAGETTAKDSHDCWRPERKSTRITQR